MNVKLLIIHGRPQGKSLLFPPGEYVFGRGTECHIRPNSDWVSRQHCLLRVSTNGTVSVRDLGSRNGTLVNGTRILTETPLENGDHLQVGPLVFETYLEPSTPNTFRVDQDDTGVHHPAVTGLPVRNADQLPLLRDEPLPSLDATKSGQCAAVPNEDIKETMSEAKPIPLGAKPSHS